MVSLADQPSYLICQIDFLQVLLYPLAVARTRIYTALLLLIAVVIVVAPIDESFDRWDQPLTSGNWKGSSAARDKERLQPAVGHLAAASISADAAVTVSTVLFRHRSHATKDGTRTASGSDGISSVGTVRSASTLQFVV